MKRVVLLMASLAILAASGFSQADNKPLTKVKVGHLVAIDLAPLFVAKESGCFAQQGLDVETVFFSNPGDNNAALAGGAIDISVNPFAIRQNPSPCSSKSNPSSTSPESLVLKLERKHPPGMSVGAALHFLFETPMEGTGKHTVHSPIEPNIQTLVRKLVTDELNPQTVADEVLYRIERHRENPIFISTTAPEKLRSRAAELASLSREERAKLPLFGVPFAVKDNIDVAGIPTTAGCPEFAYSPDKNAFVVDRLLSAGALLVGKCNLDQFATGLTGMRSVYGSPINPFSPDHISGGSSSGSAIAVSCGIVQFSLGTDTAGSGRIPAGFNNIFGYRPSSGLLSASGVVPCAKSLDSVSIFANEANDIRRVMAVAAGFDPSDAFSSEIRLNPTPITTPVVGVLDLRDEFFLGDGQAREAYKRAVERLEGWGYRTKVIDYAPFQELSDMTYFGPSMAERTAVLGAFISENPDATFTPVVRDAIAKAGHFTAAEAFSMLHRVKELERQIEIDTWAEVNLLCIPTAPTIHSRADVLRDPAYASTSLGSYTNFAPFLGLPAVSLPNGFRPDGLPTGAMIVGKRADDIQMLQVAESLAMQ